MPSEDERPSGIEYRTTSEVWPLEDLEFRASKDGLRFSGYAAVFNAPSERMRFGVERIRSGAFGKSLTERRSRKLFMNHSPHIVLGSTAPGTLRLSEDKRGLKAEADLPDNEWGRPVADAIRRGDIDAMSFGFNAIREEWSGEERSLIEVKLHEVSIVTDLAAYPATSVSVRSLAELPMAPEFRDALNVLFLPDATLSPEQVSILLASIDEHRRQPSTAERLAQWRAEFARV